MANLTKTATKTIATATAAAFLLAIPGPQAWSAVHQSHGPDIAPPSLGVSAIEPAARLENGFASPAGAPAAPQLVPEAGMNVNEAASGPRASAAASPHDSALAPTQRTDSDDAATTLDRLTSIKSAADNAGARGGDADQETVDRVAAMLYGAGAKRQGDTYVSAAQGGVLGRLAAFVKPAPTLAAVMSKTELLAAVSLARAHGEKERILAQAVAQLTSPRLAGSLTSDDFKAIVSASMGNERPVLSALVDNQGKPGPEMRQALRDILRSPRQDGYAITRAAILAGRMQDFSMAPSLKDALEGMRLKDDGRRDTEDAREALVKALIDIEAHDIEAGRADFVSAGYLADVVQKEIDAAKGSYKSDNEPVSSIVIEMRAKAASPRNYFTPAQKTALGAAFKPIAVHDAKHGDGHSRPAFGLTLAKAITTALLTYLLFSLVGAHAAPAVLADAAVAPGAFAAIVDFLQQYWLWLALVGLGVWLMSPFSRSKPVKEQTSEDVRRILSDASPISREQEVRAISYRADRQAFSRRLAEMVAQDPSPRVRAAAARGLLTYGDAADVAAVGQAMEAQAISLKTRSFSLDEKYAVARAVLSHYESTLSAEGVKQDERYAAMLAGISDPQARASVEQALKNLKAGGLNVGAVSHFLAALGSGVGTFIVAVMISGIFMPMEPSLIVSAIFGVAKVFRAAAAPAEKRSLLDNLKVPVRSAK